MLPTKFGVNWLLGLGEEVKNRFSRWLPWWPSWISDRHDLANFDLQVTLMLPSKFVVNWPFGSGEEGKNRFSRWRLWQPSWISNRNDFSYFWSKVNPMLPTQYRVNWPRESRLLKQLLMLHDRQCTADYGHRLTTIAHHEHFVLREVKICYTVFL